MTDQYKSDTERCLRCGHEGDPCPDCGELMDVGAVGNPGETITWQDCEDCGIGWGPFTGFVPLDEDETGAPLSTDTDR